MPTQASRRGHFRPRHSSNSGSAPFHPSRRAPHGNSARPGFSNNPEQPLSLSYQGRRETGPQRPTDAPEIVNDFSRFGLNQDLVWKLSTMGVTEPTPIQSQSIQPALDGRDVIGIAETGTGKTLAFALPICQNLRHGELALVLAPTRELAEQISDTFFRLGKRPILLIGGANMGRQIQDLRKRQDIIVATPGRLLDHLDRGSVYLDTVSMVVLDEGDRMLDLGFAKAIDEILQSTPDDRQTMLFSATFPRSIEELSMGYLLNPVEVRVSSAGTPPDQIDQELIYVKHEDKAELYAQILDESQGSVLVFSRTRHGARKLAMATRNLGYTAAEMHSDRTLAQRRDALKGFRAGEHRILVATDIAARGIDVKDISLVVNYDLPDNPEDYVHRIGRTGRAGAKGRALTLATPEQFKDIRGIEKVVQREIPLSELSLAAPVAPQKQSGGNGTGGRSGGNFRRRRAFRR